jgi:hypothetical protein
MDRELASNLADKMNKITEAFSDKVDNSEALLVKTEDFITETEDFVTANIEDNCDSIEDVINLQNMVEDIKYIRTTLQDSTDLGKKLLKTISTEIEIEPDPKMLASYAELSNVLNENMKLYLQCYKDDSLILLNLSKTKNKSPTNVTNITVEAENTPSIKSTAELIKELSNKDVI